MTDSWSASMRKYADILTEGEVADELVKLFALTDEQDPQGHAAQVAQRLAGTLGKHDSGHDNVYMVTIDQEFLKKLALDLESMQARRKQQHSPYRMIDSEDVDEAIANVLYTMTGPGMDEDEYDALHDVYASRIIPAFGFDDYETRWSGRQPDPGTDEEQWLSYKEDEYTKDRNW